MASQYGRGSDVRKRNSAVVTQASGPQNSLILQSGHVTDPLDETRSAASESYRPTLMTHAMLFTGVEMFSKWR